MATKRLSCRAARTEDLDALMTLEQSAFPGDRLSRRQMRYHLHNEKAKIWVCADRDDIPAAYLLAFFHENRPPRLYSVAVGAHMRGQGIGEKLVRTFLSEAKTRKKQTAFLEVRADSAPAIALYCKLGFKEKNRIPAYYEDGCTGIKMIVKL